MASGMPSSARQIRTTGPAVSASSARPGARSSSSRTAGTPAAAVASASGGGNASGVTG